MISYITPVIRSYITPVMMIYITPAMTSYDKLFSPVADLDAASFLFLIMFFLLSLNVFALLFFWVDVLEPTQFHVLFKCTK